MIMLLVGLVMVVLSAVMLYAAWPRNGEMVSFLRIRYVEATYAVTLTMVAVLGVAAIATGATSIVYG
jgi:hypothetical protein